MDWVVRVRVTNWGKRGGRESVKRVCVCVSTGREGKKCVGGLTKMPIRFFFSFFV